MKVLAVHNYYRESGGEDVVFRAETALLEAHGHTVVRYTAHNGGVSSVGSTRDALRAIWNAQAVRDLRRVIREARPNVMHVHNTLAVLSPAVYSAAHAEEVPVVQTLHNYRLLCPGANLYRDGRICEACIGRRTSWPGVLHGCYRGSTPATAVVAAIRSTHDVLGTWRRRVHRYIAPSEFAKQKFVEAGWASSAIAVKPNFVDPDPGIGRHEGGYVLFVGRLSPEKGLGTLLAAQRLLHGYGRPLKIAGTGAMGNGSLSSGDQVDWLGQRTHAEISRLMKDAAVLVFPSECYETFGLAIIEAFATGLPVIASRRGAMAEVVTDGETGLLFSPGDAHDLASKIGWALSHRDELSRMGRRCRAEFESRYTARSNYELLTDVYRAAAHKADRDVRTSAEWPHA